MQLYLFLTIVIVLVWYLWLLLRVQERKQKSLLKSVFTKDIDFEKLPLEICHTYVKDGFFFFVSSNSTLDLLFLVCFGFDFDHLLSSVSEANDVFSVQRWNRLFISTRGNEWKIWLKSNENPLITLAPDCESPFVYSFLFPFLCLLGRKVIVTFVH